MDYSGSRRMKGNELRLGTVLAVVCATSWWQAKVLKTAPTSKRWCFVFNLINVANSHSWLWQTAVLMAQLWQMSWTQNFLQTFFQVEVGDWKMALACYIVHLSLSNQQLCFLAECEKNSFLEPSLSWVCTRSSFSSWGWREEKRDLTSVALGIRRS